MKKLIVLAILAMAMVISGGCKADLNNIENMTIGEVKDKVVEQSKAVIESMKKLTAAVSEEEFKSEGNILQIVTKRGLELADVEYDIPSGSLSYSVNGTQYQFIKAKAGEKSQYIIDMLDDEKDIKAVETFLTDKSTAAKGFISTDAVNKIMETVRNKAEDKTLVFDGGESSVTRKDGRVIINIRF